MISNKEIKDFIEESEKLIKLSLIISIIINLISLAPVVYMKNIYGPVVNSASVHTLSVVTFLLAAMLILSGIFEWVRFEVLKIISENFTGKFSKKIYETSFKLYLNDRDPSSRKLVQEVKVIRTFITSPVFTAILDAPLGLMFLFVVIYIHPQMGIASVLMALIMVAINWRTESKIKPITEESNELHIQSQIYIADSVSNAQSIQAMGMIDNLKNRWQKKYFNYNQKLNKINETQINAASATKFIMLLQGSLIIGVGCLLTLEGSLPPGGGSMIIASILGGKAIQPMMRLIGGWRQLFAVKEAYENISNALEKNIKEKNLMKLPTPEGRLEIENLIARPPGTKKPVINGMTFTLKQGRSLAIIGESGSGKSTLTKLLVGVWRPLSGAVRLDGADIYSWPKNELGKFLGYLPQEIELIEGTILENICRFGIEDQKQAEMAAKLIGIHDYIKSLKEGYLTKVNEEDGIFSGGQIQKIAMARAIYGDPKLVVLDEPNSNLDKKGELDLYKAIEYLKNKSTTVVIVTHRPQILKYVDRILLVSEGKPKIYGPRDLVLQKIANKN